MKDQTAPIVVMVGTKAQYIKTAPILVAMDRIGLSYQLVYTGQHSETFEALERVFGVRQAPDNLVPGNESDTAHGLFGWSLRFLWVSLGRIRKGAWRDARWGVVHGDTMSALLGALVFRLSGIGVAHVEAGLRSPRLWSPFPEEIIRRLISRMASLHFAPDAASAANLEGVRGTVVDTAGNTLADALRLAVDAQAEDDPGVGRESYAVASLHRSENLSSSSRLALLMQEVIHASRRIPLKFVLHPVTRKTLVRSGWWDSLAAEPGITMLDRTDYISFIRLLRGSRFLLTDGGSNQEEAAMLGLPTLLMREETERLDGIGTGVVELSGLDPAKIREFVETHSSRNWSFDLRLPSQSPSATVVDRLAASVRGAPA